MRSEQSSILGRHELQDIAGPPSEIPVANLHSRLVAATDEVGKLRAGQTIAGAGEPLLDKVMERMPEPKVTLDYVHNLVQEVRDHLEMDVDKQPEAYGKSLIEEDLPRQRLRNRDLAKVLDNWQHRSQHMRCETCMWFVPKRGLMEENTEAEMEQGVRIGRCRNSSPTMKGWPAMFPTDWCGDHKLDETKL